MKSTKLVFVLSFFTLLGCQKPVRDLSHPMISDVKVTAIASAPESAQNLAVLKAQQFAPPTAAVTADPVVKAEVTFTKSDIFNRDFLYGADLQYSSIHDAQYDLMAQSQANGLLIARFRVVGSTLQLIANQDFNFESDVNHPGRLINEFTITKQDDKTLTVTIAQASPLLATIATSSKAPPVRTNWVRSVQFISQGNYLNYETSIEMADGSIVEFMETLFPRDTLVSGTPKVLYNDEALEPMAKRFHFLDGGDIWLSLSKGRTKTKVVNRFSLVHSQPVVWYVTSNIPSEFVPYIKSAIEGWNRYSQAMWKSDILKFGGLLPQGVKIGDPRYNVINWDSVAAAGAAYESQDADPLTGIQSHSLIYLPAAWINIGKTYWQSGESSEAQQALIEALRAQMNRGTFLGRGLGIHCIQDSLSQISLEARMNPDQFAKELLKGVLFHEVGHALGMAHNFKGSLSFNPNDSKPVFSTSIMDYNQYQIEKAAFDSLESSQGPLLEYDRQLLSVLYNDGKDIKAKDPVLAACEDSESDSVEGGVDPLCIRYDAGNDPTQELVYTLDLVRKESAHLYQTQSLAHSLTTLGSELPDAAKIKTADDANTALSKFRNSIKGVIGFYYVSGAQSIGYMMSANIRSLYRFQADVLPAPYDEMAMRKRAMDSLAYVLGLETVDPSAKTQLSALATLMQTWLTKTAYYQSSSKDEQNKIVADLTKGLKDYEDSFDGALISKLRTRILGALVRVNTAPFYLGPLSGSTVDFEKMAIDMLEEAVVNPDLGLLRPVAERVAAAKSLLTFKDTSEGADAIGRVKTRLKSEEARASDADSRENSRTIQAVFSK